MKGVGWEASKSLDVQQAKKAGDLVSEVTFYPEYLAVINCAIKSNCIKLQKYDKMVKY